jgi:U4/U6.U5 tri-snRNP-associated protein 2
MWKIFPRYLQIFFYFYFFLIQQNLNYYLFDIVGRGPSTHAYLHSVGEGHHVFLNLHTLRFYCLPDNYEIIDSSLDDIKYVLNPTFTLEHIASLDLVDRVARSCDGTVYRPGIVGLNNIKANDYCNVVLQVI